MAATLEVRAGNRLETLAAWLAAGIRSDPLDPFEPERIVVPHPTLGRWLTLQIASNLGIAANLSIELPAQFAWSIMRGALGSLSAETPFAPDRLRWRIFEALDGFAGPGTEPVTRYLQDGDARKRFELADRLARVYDRCLLYRPDWIRAWESGETPHWQASLWQRLTAGDATQPRHWVAAIDAFREASFSQVSNWPSRVSFFGIAALSPSYLDVLRLASAHIDVRLFLLSPSEEFWADTAPRRVIRRRAEPLDPADEYRTEGNELLGAWGKPARDMQGLLLDIELATGTPDDWYHEPTGSTALAAVQRDILKLRLAAEGAECDDEPILRQRDDSIQIHVCHSAMREAEVLHDRLLGIFDDHPDVQPADVLVLTPNIVGYAPAIEAVFAAAGSIPCNIALPRASATRAVRALLDLLALPGSRYSAEAVLAPLESDAVRGRFGIAEQDLQTLREWVRNAGIRWGIDRHHRDDEDLPAIDDHSWRQGLDRLLLGHAMDGDDVLFEGVAPCSVDSPVFAGDHELLGRFVTYCEGVFALRDWEDNQRSPSDWARTLRNLLVERFFADDWSNIAETSSVNRMIDGFGAECEVETPVPFGVLRDVLGAAADHLSRPAARLADGVTVTSLAIGQAFPAKVVCAVGMNDGLFPRRSTPATFDLVSADDDRRGDRSVRDEDRFAFLEAFLAARECFVITYTGRNSRNDKPIPPSVVVDEMREYLAKRFPHLDSSRDEADAEADVRKSPFEILHPLQPFSRRYFEPGNELFSYSGPMLDAALAVAKQGRGEAGPLRFAGPVAVDAPPAKVDLDDLVRFFGNPTRSFLRDGLGIRLETDDVALKDVEPFDLDHLEQWQLKDGIFPLARRGEPAQEIETLMMARGRLPNGNAGRIVHEDAHAEVSDLLGVLAEYRDALGAPPREIDLELGGFHLTGSLEGVDANRNTLLWWRVGGIREKDKVEAWLKLLALTAALDAPASAYLVGSKGTKQVALTGPGAEEAHHQLTRWIELRQRGLRELLPFSPGTSLPFARVVADPNKDRDAAMRAATAKWYGGEYTFGDNNDAYIALAYGGGDPLTEVFAELAEELLLPLVEAEG